MHLFELGQTLTFGIFYILIFIAEQVQGAGMIIDSAPPETFPSPVMITNIEDVSAKTWEDIWKMTNDVREKNLCFECSPFSNLLSIVHRYEEIYC